MTRKNRTNEPSSPGGGKHRQRQPWPLDVRLAVARAVVEEHLSARRAAAMMGLGIKTQSRRKVRYHQILFRRCASLRRPREAVQARLGMVRVPDKSTSFLRPERRSLSVRAMLELGRGSTTRACSTKAL